MSLATGKASKMLCERRLRLRRHSATHLDEVDPLWVINQLLHSFH